MDDVFSPDEIERCGLTYPQLIMTYKAFETNARFAILRAAEFGEHSMFWDDMCHDVVYNLRQAIYYRLCAHAYRHTTSQFVDAGHLHRISILRWHYEKWQDCGLPLVAKLQSGNNSSV
jgi:hypothetical protein